MKKETDVKTGDLFVHRSSSRSVFVLILEHSAWSHTRRVIWIDFLNDVTLTQKVMYKDTIRAHYELVSRVS